MWNKRNCKNRYDKCCCYVQSTVKINPEQSNKRKRSQQKRNKNQQNNIVRIKTSDSAINQNRLRLVNAMLSNFGKRSDSTSEAIRASSNCRKLSNDPVARVLPPAIAVDMLIAYTNKLQSKPPIYFCWGVQTVELDTCC